ncbi:hypothetical protein [Aquiflexum gelatinilyticum]|uniref:hypothetical protein n=1 Tax=Aquiflexum gelatinilyticum TaxID=2961943 RepID=UPI002168BF5A|nr:hypothetical protein [Aquiflexum gelatinilyticum]MCS4432897.1 hypothetical protein [Aquiflexum gelatinilyticum]
MRTLKNYLASLALVAAIMFSSCNPEEEIPGIGEGKMGIAFILKTNQLNAENARTLNSSLSIEGGFIQIKELELELKQRGTGTSDDDSDDNSDDDNNDDSDDDNGGDDSNEIEIKFRDIRKITFDALDKSTDFFINIPEGEYKEIELEVDLIDYKNEPSIYFEGKINNADGTSKPFKFEFFGDDIDFEVEIEAEDDDNYFKVDRINNPLALFEINALNWFQNVSDSELQEAVETDGMVIISKNSNKSLYEKVKNNIKASSEIEVELD